MSRKRVLLTVGSVVVAILAVIGVGGMLIGSLLGPPSSEITDDPTPTSAVAVTAENSPTTVPATQSSVPSAAVVATAPPVSVVPVRPASGVVVIDAGHQGKGDSSTEPIGPGSSVRKPKVAGGASGTSTKKPEGQVNLDIAFKLKEELQKRGVTVIMVRDSQNVNIANSARAAIANKADADLFIRLHCDGNGNSGMAGLSTLVPGENKWTGPIVGKSGIAGRLVHNAAVAATGAKDRGVVKRNDMAGFNWSTVPTVLVEMGFMSNAAEDRKLSTADYQQRLAVGMADGVVEYLKTN